MIWMLIALCFPPLAAAGWIAYSRRPAPAEWQTYARRIGILFGLGLFAAAPFVSTNSLGTSEAYNYSLSVADAVTQFRSGQFPILVGQSEFAFNGRIHPLRTAPYFDYFACLLDLLTFRHLSFWALQNLALAISLVAGAFSLYAGLRASTRTDPRSAVGLTALFLLAPGVLAPAYGMDLYMTVMTIPYIPVVITALILILAGEGNGRIFLFLAAALAASWLAHPPVALWLSFLTALLLAFALVSGRLKPRTWFALGAAGLLGAALAVFVVVSVLTIRTYQDITDASAPEAIFQQVLQAFPHTLRPISAAADKLGDFQLGYALWLLLIGSAIAGFIRRKRTTLALLAVTFAVAAFAMPIPGLTRWLWAHTPTFVSTLTSLWPMQRLYLILSALIVFAAASVGPIDWKVLAPKAARDLVSLALAALCLWTVYQSWRFIGRGFASQHDALATTNSHQSENIDLTLISYAMFKPPPAFTNGVVDPLMEFQLLRRGTAEPFATNWNSPEALDAAHTMRGTFTVRYSENDIAQLSPTLKVKPGTRYRLDFAFRTPPLKATLALRGTHTNRFYPLPSSGESSAFGMKPSNNRSLTLWTSQPDEEAVNVDLIGPGMGSARQLLFADFVFQPINMAKLPVVVESWIPLRLKIHSPEPGYVETPRLFIAGYSARVNGKPSRVQSSPHGLVMTEIPAGDSDVEIDYPGLRPLRLAFWLTFWSWLGLVTLGSTALFSPRFGLLVNASCAKLGSLFWRYKVPLLTVAIATSLMLWGWSRWAHYREAAGPLHIRLVLPRGETGRSQPLLTTGQPKAGCFIFIIYQDPTHIRVGIDVWGRGFGWTSEPIPVDYFTEQDFVVSSAALYPLGHPKLAGADLHWLKSLRQHITVDLNGKRVLDQPVDSFPSDLSDITVGLDRIGGSSTEPRFVGQILSVERLPIPAKP